MIVTTADELPRLMACIGSRLLPASFPSQAGDTTARDEGIAAHYLAQVVFSGQFALSELTDRKAPNGVYISGDMADHVEKYLSALDCGEMEIDTSWGNERWRVNARADHVVYNAESKTLTVDDLKYGWRLVDPVHHWSLIWHAIGYCYKNKLSPDFVNLRIHQPRPWHPDGNLRTWTITGQYLWQLHDQLNDALSSPLTTLITGPQCAGCHALATCPAARSASMNALDATGNAMPDNIDNDALSDQLDVLTAASEKIDLRLQALRELASHRLSQGQVINNYSRQPTFANTRWKSGLDGRTLSLLTGRDLTNPATLVTPAEAKRRGVDQAVINLLTERPLTGQKLVRMSATERAMRAFKKKG